MHILLTDVLVCPRCGPSFGLILLADRIEARRVIDGKLGCPNCREQYLIRGGEADLRTGAGAVTPTSHTEKNVRTPSTDAVPLAALLGVTQGPAYVLLAGDAALHASAVSAQMEDVEVIAVRTAPPGDADTQGISSVIAEAIPLTTGKMAGVAITGARVSELLEAAARAVRPTGRLLVEPAPEDAELRLRGLGLRVLAREGDVLLASRG
jgi:uncharacterized protein YbaR (Trm112 family)